jgi:eukaryotic-like serine/threonine-protein kinase
MVSHIGEQFGNYRLLRLLGTGGFAEVYLGEHVHLQTQAAIKVVLTQLSRQEEKFFKEEARMAASLIHPHIVRVLEFGIEGKIPYLVMDYAPNGTLRDRYPIGNRLPLPLVITQVKQIAQALQFAHDEKLVHRDIKPENILIGRHQEILLSDFGIAVVAHSTRSQRTQDIIGTVDYMAPEQIQAHPSIASDQYALAAMTYEWLCGMPPFTGTAVEILAGHLHAQPDVSRLHLAAIPQLVEHVILKALEKEPGKRFARVAAFANALEHAGMTNAPGSYSVPSQFNATSTGPVVANTPNPLVAPQSGKGSLLYLYRGHTDHVHTLAWCPDRRRIASAGVDSQVRVWDAATGREFAIYKHPGYVVNAVAWSPNGQYLASAGSDGSVQIWDTNNSTGSAFKSFSSARCAINALDWSPDGEYLTFGYINGKIAIYSLNTGYQTERRAATSISALVWSPDGNLLAYADVGGNLQICSITIEESAPDYIDEDYEEDEVYEDEEQDNIISTIELEDKCAYNYDESIAALAWSPDSKYLLGGYEDGQAEIWDATDEEATEAKLHYSGHHETIRAVGWSMGRKRVATGGDDATVHIWDANTGRQILVYKGHKDVVRCIAWSPDKKRIASGSEDTTVQIWSAS